MLHETMNPYYKHFSDVNIEGLATWDIYDNRMELKSISKIEFYSAGCAEQDNGFHIPSDPVNVKDYGDFWLVSWGDPMTVCIDCDEAEGLTFSPLERGVHFFILKFNFLLTPECFCVNIINVVDNIFY